MNKKFLLKITAILILMTAAIFGGWHWGYYQGHHDGWKDGRNSRQISIDYAYFEGWNDAFEHWEEKKIEETEMVH